MRLKKFASNTARDGSDFLLLFREHSLEIFQDRELFQAIGENYPFTTGKLRSMSFSQDQNVMTILHPDHINPWELVYEDGKFRLGVAPLESVLPAPKTLHADIRTKKNTDDPVEAVYVVTSVDSQGQESAASTPLHLVDLDKELSVVLFWTEVASATHYNVYRSTVGTNLYSSAPVKLVASRVASPQWTDSGEEPIDLTPPEYENPIVPGLSLIHI